MHIILNEGELDDAVAAYVKKKYKLDVDPCSSRYVITGAQLSSNGVTTNPDISATVTCRIVVLRSEP